MFTGFRPEKRELAPMKKPYKYELHQAADPAMVERLERIADRLTQVICAIGGHDWDNAGVCKACDLVHPRRAEQAAVRRPRRSDG